MKFRRQNHKGADPIGCTHPDKRMVVDNETGGQEWGRRKENKIIINYRIECTWCGATLKTCWSDGTDTECW